MAKLYIMCGLAFSGKSTLAKKIASHGQSELIAFDQLWIEEEVKQQVPKNAEGWRYIRNIAQEKVLSSLKAGISVVYDDNNSRKEHREELRRIAKQAGADAVVIYLDTPLNIIKDREEANKTSHERHDVEPENFQKVMKDLEVPTVDENTLVFIPKMDIGTFLEKLLHQRV